MKYIKYEDLLNHKEIRIIKVELKPNAKMTEEEWFRFMVSGNILKIADTIEELCDEFVIYQLWTKSYYIGTKAVGSIKSNIESKYYLSMGYENPVVYGAIWVENKGLIFVARMNNEGVMELL